MRRAAALMALGAALVGCMPDQAKDVDAYRSLTSLGAEPSAPSGAASLTLTTAVELTNDSSERLAIQGEEFVRAIAERRRAVASFLPTVDLLPVFEFNDAPNGNGTGIAVGDGVVVGDGGAETSFDVAVSTRVTLFDGFRNVNRLTSAEADIENRRALVMDVRETLVLDLVRSFYAVLVAERSVEVLTRSLALQEERLRDIQGRQKAGVARPLDVFQTEAQVASTRVSLLDAQNDVVRGRELLAFLVGSPIQGCSLVDDFTVPAELETLEVLTRRAERTRQDLAAAEAAARSARALVDVAIGQYAPSLSLNLDWFLKRDSVPTDQDWAGALSLNVPIFTAGRIEADIQDAWSVFRQQVLAYQALRREIRRDVAVARADVDASARRLEEIDVQVRAAREAYRQADASYQVGLATNLERLVALDQQQNAELAQALEIYRHRGLYAVLLRATGRLTEGLTGVDVPDPPEMPAPDSPFIRVADDR